MLGTHLIFTAYGFWLPNDPRGSGSTHVRAHHLYERGGDATAVTTTRSVAKRPHDRALRLETKEALARPPVVFTGIQARAIGTGFATIVAKLQLTVHACAILPEHVHAVVAAHRLDGDAITEALKRAGTRRLNGEAVAPYGSDYHDSSACGGSGILNLGTGTRITRSLFR
ncbi:MAG: hypothetical protein IH898_11665 [Planctomycetes bacterium]|nr:hypothetical protein [Planctomycetota bacterium]